MSEALLLFPNTRCDIGIPYVWESRRLAGYPGPDDSQDSGSTGADARLRDRAAHRANQWRPAFRQLWNAVSGAAEAGAGGMYLVRVGRFGQQPQGEVLQAQTGRAQRAA